MLTQPNRAPLEELNTTLEERWTKKAPTQVPNEHPALPSRPRLTLNHNIRTYVREASESVNSGSWLSRREIPTSGELLGDINADGGENGDGDDDELEVPVNLIRGPWASKEDYLSAHYELLREDAVAPLRDAVAEVKELPTMMDNQNICIYENVGFFVYRACVRPLTHNQLGSHQGHDFYPPRSCG